MRRTGEELIKVCEESLAEREREAGPKSEAYKESYRKAFIEGYDQAYDEAVEKQVKEQVSRDGQHRRG